MNRMHMRVLASAVICAVSTPALAKTQTPLPERLLSPADFERVGMKGIVRPSADGFDPQEGLHFVRTADSTLVLTVSPLPRVSSSAELRGAMGSMSSETTRLSGVGDEAFIGMGGFLLMFRQGATAYQLLVGTDPITGDKALVTPDQLVDLAKVVASRSATVATSSTEGQGPKTVARHAEPPPAPVYPGATFDAQTSAGFSSSGPDSVWVYVTSDPAAKVVAFYQTKTGKQAQNLGGGSFAFYLRGGSGLPDLTVESNLAGLPGKTAITIVKHWR